MNSIENLWNEVKRAIRGKCSPNYDQLWNIIQDACYAIPLHVFQNLVNSVPTRCAVVLTKKKDSQKSTNMTLNIYTALIFNELC